jgi:hypothetical protein
VSVYFEISPLDTVSSGPQRRRKAAAKRKSLVLSRIELQTVQIVVTLVSELFRLLEKIDSRLSEQLNDIILYFIQIYMYRPIIIPLIVSEILNKFCFTSIHLTAILLTSYVNIRICNRMPVVAKLCGRDYLARSVLDILGRSYSRTELNWLSSQNFITCKVLININWLKPKRCWI